MHLMYVAFAQSDVTWCMVVWCGLQLNTHAPYVCGFAWSDVNGAWLYGVHRTRRDGKQIHVAPAIVTIKTALEAHHSGRYPKTRCKKAAVIHSAIHMQQDKLQALVYDILPSTTALFSYATGSRKLSANEQFFVGAQTVVNLLQTRRVIL